MEQLADVIRRDVRPGSVGSSIAVMSDVEAASLPEKKAMEIFKDKCIIVKATGGGDPSWDWGNLAFSRIRPVAGTEVQVQSV